MTETADRLERARDETLRLSRESERLRDLAQALRNGTQFHCLMLHELTAGACHGLSRLLTLRQRALEAAAAAERLRRAHPTPGQPIRT